MRKYDHSERHYLHPELGYRYDQIMEWFRLYFTYKVSLIGRRKFEDVHSTRRGLGNFGKHRIGREKNEVLEYINLQI